MAKTRKKGVLRDHIVKAAEKKIAEKGFHETTMAEIPAAAGVSEPAIHENFTSKEEIFFTIPVKISCSPSTFTAYPGRTRVPTSRAAVRQIHHLH